MRILVIEDNPLISQSLTELLQQKSAEVDCCATGSEGLQKALGQVNDVIILDLGLPDQAGSWVCDQLRKHHCPTPILILTSEASKASVVQLLGLGADDYVTKPFVFAELWARLQAVVRRAQPLISAPTSAPLTRGPLTLHPHPLMVEVDRHQIPVRLQEWRVLKFMMYHPHQVLSRETLISQVWSTKPHTSHNTVDVYVKKLRQKLTPLLGYSPIVSVHGQGYVWTLH